MKNLFVFKFSLIFLILILFFLVSGGSLLSENRVCSAAATDSETLTKLDGVAGEVFNTKGVEGIKKSKNLVLDLINKIVKIILGIVGALAFGLFVYGGLLWMTAHGNETQVKKGQTVIYQATLGLIVIILSYALVSLVIKKITTP